MLAAREAIISLLDRYGGTRDITFTPVTGKAIRSFLTLLFDEYSIESASDNEGNDIRSTLASREFETLLNLERGFIHAILHNDSMLIRRLQVFIDWEPMDHKYDLELSFYPDDLSLDQLNIEVFVRQLNRWNEVLMADDYFVRHENASWELYDTNGLGVIFTRKNPVLA